MKFWLFYFTNPEDKVSHFELIRIGRFAFFVINVDKRVKDEIAVDISTLQSNRECQGMIEHIPKSNCIHDWKNDPMFEYGVIIMFTSMQGEEMRQYCSKCRSIRYVSKKALQDMNSESGN